MTRLTQTISPPKKQVLLARPEFTALTTAPAVAAKLAPLTLAQHLHAPFDAMQRYETQLQALLEATKEGHPDHGPLLVRIYIYRGWFVVDLIVLCVCVFFNAPRQARNKSHRAWSIHVHTPNTNTPPPHTHTRTNDNQTTPQEALALVRDIGARMDKTLADARMFRRIQVCIRGLMCGLCLRGVVCTWGFVRPSISIHVSTWMSIARPILITPTHPNALHAQPNPTNSQAIRDSILVLAPPLIGQPDPLASLVSTERRLLREGTLLKVGPSVDVCVRVWGSWVE